MRSGNLACFGSFVGVADFVFHHLTVVQTAEPSLIYTGLVHEDVLTVLADDEPPAFLHVEPFHLK